jgi:hypothetical protein
MDRTIREACYTASLHVSPVQFKPLSNKTIRSIEVYTTTPLERPRRRRVDNIKMDLEMGWGDVDWIGLAQDRGRLRALVNTASNLRVP